MNLLSSKKHDLFPGIFEEYKKAANDEKKIVEC